ncbi:hypothetical protein ASPWEDRAFT_118432 [Aspergillus wentii DTO 134E9]|uniref:DUF3824 domain-containing protein n=1 Tax=Aspergillus wentii DTO 134E9 TaxID=1073089 RepID=A0A1L9R783_ASPWE|nr:uncharacterized protein ASPWEDRAFT_118432 [Aspergillus wentii DTO 134E9]OJJ30758.1 hypothetical protein ASPWEDRAFT_118432 [Aspergillus wentii DTO 134E9]
MSYIYRERDRERDWDEPRSSVSIKRYVIPPEDERERDYLVRREDPYTGDRELMVRRSTDHHDDPVLVRRYERDVDYEPRYRSERDYYEPRGPIYINPRESDYDVVHRSEVDRDPHYHHRRFREYEDDRRLRRELSPADSISQASRRRDDQDYSSDDSMVYVRKETREYDDHPHHRRHLAEGALVGAGAAELYRSHRKKEGEEVSDGAGRLGRTVGAGALGAVAVNAASRARDYYRSKSRHRSHSFDDDHGSHHHRRRRRHRHGHSHSHSRRSRSRSRSHSHSRAKTLTELGLGAAAIAGAVALARSKSKSKDDRRSRSRRRTSSRSRSRARSRTGDGDGDDDETRSQSQRRKHMAGAGLAGAAVAGLVERARSHSRSRKGERSRSHSRFRQALPVVAAGLGTAAATGLYEKSQDRKKEGEDGSRHRERRRSRSRSRTPSEVYPDPSRDSAGLIEYGRDPVHGSIPTANYYGRSPSPSGYYSDATDPVASGAAGYGSSRNRDRSRSRSRSRSRGVRYGSTSDSDQDSGRRRKSHHRSRDLAGAALAATGAGYAAHKYSQRKDRKKAGQDRDRPGYDDDNVSRDPYEESYNPEPYPPSPPAAPQQQIDDRQYYPNTNYFAPPPSSAPHPASNGAPYRPADYPPPPGAAPPPQPYGYPPPPGPDPYAPRPRRADENVSAAQNWPFPTAKYHTQDGLEAFPPLGTPRAKKRRSRAVSHPALPKSVSFDLNSGTSHDRQMDPGYETDDSDSTIGSLKGDRQHGYHRRCSSDPYSSKSNTKSRPGGGSSTTLDAGKNIGSDSDSTIDLPARFDSQGKLLPQRENDPVVDRLEDLIRDISKVLF